MLGKHHSEASKRKISKPGTSNPMYGKKRPDLSNSNKDPTLAAKRGKSVSSHRLKQKLKRFGCSTAEELFEKIQNILAQHDCINKVGREPGSINFNKVGEYFQTPRISEESVKNEEVEQKHEKKHGKMHHKFSKKMLELAHKHAKKNY
jgi:hypothetical protein